MTTTSTTRKNVCKLAWQLVKNNGFNLSEAMKQAWKNIKLTAAMVGKAVHFAYLTVKGEVRKAIGTLQASMLPETKGTGRAKCDAVQVYFDLDRNAFRSYRKATLLSVEL